ncbi:hypothetical protein PFISCL1PPCAC_28450, partial [Pristionchus fissidentatus]
AFNFSSIDNQMGSIVSRGIELMESVMKGGANVETMEMLLKSTNLALEYDDKRADSLRNLLYSFCTGLGSSIASITEASRQRKQTGVVESTMQVDFIDKDFIDIHVELKCA